MREKDWKKCWPFDFDGDYESAETISLLPPFHVPQFRWWRCQNCRKETPAGGAIKDLIVDYCYVAFLLPQVSHLYIFAVFSMSGVEKSSNLDMPDAIEAIANASTDLCNLNHPPSFTSERQKKAEGILCSDFSILMSYFYRLLITLFVSFQEMRLTLDGS